MKFYYINPRLIGISVMSGAYVRTILKGGDGAQRLVHNDTYMSMIHILEVELE